MNCGSNHNKNESYEVALQARDCRWEKHRQKTIEFHPKLLCTIALLPDTHIAHISLNKGQNNVKVGYMFYTQCDFNHKN